MGFPLERIAGYAHVNWSNSVNSAEVELGSHSAHWILVQGDLGGKTLNVQIERPGATGSWDDLLDSSGSLVAINTSADGWVPIVDLPIASKLRFVVNSAITLETFINSHS